MKKEQKASLYILFYLLFLGLWFFGVYDYIWEKYQIHRLTPDLRINIIGLDKPELDKRYYHFVTDYTESGLPLKGGVGFTKEEYDATRLRNDN